MDRHVGLESLLRDLEKFGAQARLHAEDHSANSWAEGFQTGRASALELAAMWLRREIDHMKGR